MKTLISFVLLFAVSGCAQTQVDWSQIKNKPLIFPADPSSTFYDLFVTQNPPVTSGGYIQFPPVTYNPYNSVVTCFDVYGNPVQQPLPPAGRAAFGPNDLVLWSSLSPSLQFAAGTGVGLVQKVVFTAPPSTNTGPCGAPLPVNGDYGLNTNGYFFGRGGLATDNPYYNSIQSLQGGIVGNSFTAGVLYPGGTTVCTATSGSICTATRVLAMPEYLGGHIDTGHSNGPPQGNSMQTSSNPFSAGEGNVAGQIYYDDTLQCERVYSGTAWSCMSVGGGGSPAGPLNSLQTNNGSGNFGGFSSLVYDAGSNLLVVTGTAGQGMIAPLFNAGAGGTNLEFQGSQFSVRGDGHIATNGWLDLGERAAPPTQAGHAVMYADSGTHQLLLSLNNGSYFPIGGGGGGGVSSFNTRTGVVTLTSTDVSAAGGNGTFSVASTSDAFLQSLGSGLGGSANLFLSGNGGTNCWNLKSGAGTSMVLGYTNSCSGVYALTTEITFGPTGVTFAQPITVPSCTGCAGGSGSTAPLVFTGLAAAPAVSTASNANMYYNTTTGDFQASYAGASYTGLRSPHFNCTATGASSCIQQQSGTFSITGAGAAAVQSLAVAGASTTLTLGVGSGSPLTINSAGTISTSGGITALSASFSGLMSAAVGNITNLTVGSCSGCGGGGSPASPVNSVQFNNAGAFGGSSGFTYSGGTVTVNISSGSADGLRVIQSGSFLAAYMENASASNPTAEFLNQSTGPGFQAVSNNGVTVADFLSIGIGSCDIRPLTTALVCSSDARLKRDDKSITTAISGLMKLRPITFSWKNDETAGRHAGFFAQEVRPIFPELVEDGLDGYLQLNQTGMIPYLVRAIQEQQVEIERLNKMFRPFTATAAK